MMCHMLTVPVTSKTLKNLRFLWESWRFFDRFIFIFFEKCSYVPKLALWKFREQVGGWVYTRGDNLRVSFPDSKNHRTVGQKNYKPRFVSHFRHRMVHVGKRGMIRPLPGESETQSPFQISCEHSHCNVQMVPYAKLQMSIDRPTCSWVHVARCQSTGGLVSEYV